MAIDFNELPQEVRDVIELREDADGTFYRFLDCVEENEYLFVNDELKKITDVEVGDVVEGRANRRVLAKKYANKKCLEINTDCMVPFTVSEDHPVVLHNGDIKKAKDLQEGELLAAVKLSVEKGGDYEEGLFAGAYLADGCGCVFKTSETASGSGTRYCSISNGDYEFLDKLGKIALEKFKLTSYKIISMEHCCRLMLYGKEGVEQIIEKYGYSGRKLSRDQHKKVSKNLLQQEKFRDGFIHGFASCDFGVNVTGKKNVISVAFNVSFDSVAQILLRALWSAGFYPDLEHRDYYPGKRRKIPENRYRYYRIGFGANKVKEFLEYLIIHTKKKSESKDDVLKRLSELDEKLSTIRYRVPIIENGVRIPVVRWKKEVGERKCVDIAVDKDSLFCLGGGILVHNCDYSEIFFNTVFERADPNLEHSLICSITGSQGVGKCISVQESVRLDNGIYCKLRDLFEGAVISGSSLNTKVLKRFKVEDKDCLKINSHSSVPVVVSLDHKFELESGKVKKASQLNVGDVIKTRIFEPEEKGSDSDYRKAFVYGAFIADDTGAKGSYLMFSNNCNTFLKKVKQYVEKEFGFTSVRLNNASGNGKFVLMAYGQEEAKSFLEECGANSICKSIPESVFKTEKGMKGFLEGYASGDLTCNYGRNGTSYKYEIGHMVKSRELGCQILDLMHSLGHFPSVTIRELKSGPWKGREYVRIRFPVKQGIKYLESLKLIGQNEENRKSLLEFRRTRPVVNTTDLDAKFGTVCKISCAGIHSCLDISVDADDSLFVVNGGLLTHNSWSAISLCRMMDPDFTVNKIFFSYDDLVRNRHKLKPHSAVLLDEQSQSYGLDSNRVMIILQGLKEQLRKKSIHLFFCSPVLHSESNTSMYVIEVLFIDKETQESVAALKTRERQTLGHIKIPSPLKVDENGNSLATKEFMEAYEAKKDAHLEKLLGQNQDDPFEERADAVMSSSLFKQAEKVYVKKLGYIPKDRVIQIINKLYPEYNAGVVPNEIAERVRMTREMAGKWIIPGTKRGKK